MQIGVFAGERTVDALVERAQQVHEQGFSRLWVPQIFGIDALTALGVVTREVAGLLVGTAVVPTYPRHPTALAIQARTVAQISGGRLTLGIGLSHRVVIENMLGMTWGEVRHLREYLEILVPLLRGEPADFAGESLTGKITLDVPADPVPLVVAALGPKLLDLAGRLTDGTTTWVTGYDTLRDHVVPSIRKGAAAAGRPDPQVIAALPVAVTDDPDQARAVAAKAFAVYSQLPSYRAMLDREGAGGPADVAIVGDAATVRARIAEFAEIGVTEFVLVPFFEQQRTLETLAPSA